MSDFTKNEAANYEAEVRAKLIDLKNSLKDRYIRWSDWEKQFIGSVVAKLEHDKIDISPKQYQRIWDLWEKCHK